MLTKYCFSFLVRISKMVVMLKRCMHKKNKVYDKKGNKLTLIPVSTMPFWLFPWHCPLINTTATNTPVKRDRERWDVSVEKVEYRAARFCFDQQRLRKVIAMVLMNTPSNEMERSANVCGYKSSGTSCCQTFKSLLKLVEIWHRELDQFQVLATCISRQQAKKSFLFAVFCACS